MPLSERHVRRAIRDYLFRTGWGRNYQEKETHERGVDIRVRHNTYARYFLIETKGESFAKSAKSQRETAFVYSLGQIITRMQTPRARYYTASVSQNRALASPSVVSRGRSPSSSSSTSSLSIPEAKSRGAAGRR